MFNTRLSLVQWSRKPAILFFAMVFIGGACARPSTDGGIVDTFPKEKLTLTIWRPLDEAKAFNQVVSDYRSLHPNVSFDFRFIQPDLFESEVINALATGNGPDIISLPNASVAKFQNKLVAMPDNFFKGTNPVAGITAKYAPAVATDTIIDGKVFGIPLYTDTLAIYWNKTLFREIFNEKIKANVSFNQDLLIRAPGDWNEVIETAKLVTKRSGDTIDRSAIALGVSSNVPNTSDIIAAIMLQEGISMVTQDQARAAFHLPDATDPTFHPGAATLNFLSSFSDPKSDHYTWNASQPNAVDAFLNGKLAMMLHYQSVTPLLKQRAPGLQFDTAPLPQLAGARFIMDFARYHVEAVTNNSKYPQVAWDFLNQITGINQIIVTEATGRPSPLRNSPSTATVAERLFRSQPFGFQIGTAQSWFRGKNPFVADTLLRQALDRVSIEKRPARDVIDETAQNFTNLLSGQ